MMRSQDPRSVSPPFYLTPSYPCHYLPGKMARSKVAFPDALIHTDNYHVLIQQGFRRSGLAIYRPDCSACKACISVRIPTHEIQYSRSQRRALKKHGNLHSYLLPLQYMPAHFDLYQRYQAARHIDKDKKQTAIEQYHTFILKSHVNSFLVEFREDQALRMVSLIDQLEDGLSAVYTFFDPALTSTSFGVFNILWLAQQAKQMGMPYLYLGYWVRDCSKMAYKKHYQPLEGYIDGRWQRLTDQYFAPTSPFNI